MSVTPISWFAGGGGTFAQADVVKSIMAPSTIMIDVKPFLFIFSSLLRIIGESLHSYITTRLTSDNYTTALLCTVDRAC